MVGLLGSVASYTGLLALFAAPAVLVALRYGERRTARRFGVAVLALGVVCGVVSAAGRRLERLCREEGNSNCFDVGGDGLLVLILVGFLLTSLTKAYLIHND